MNSNCVLRYTELRGNTDFGNVVIYEENYQVGGKTSLAFFMIFHK